MIPPVIRVEVEIQRDRLHELVNLGFAVKLSDDRNAAVDRMRRALVEIKCLAERAAPDRSGSGTFAGGSGVLSSSREGAGTLIGER